MEIAAYYQVESKIDVFYDDWVSCLLPLVSLRVQLGNIRTSENDCKYDILYEEHNRENKQ